MNKNTFSIDNITWNDLSLDDIFSRLNSCITSAGEERLNETLKNPYIKECSEYRENVSLIEEIEKIKDKSIYNTIIMMLNNISKLKKYKFREEIKKFSEAEKQSNLKHYIIDVLVVLSFAMIFVYPGPGIVAFFIMIAYAVSDYFRTKNIISARLSVFNYLLRMINTVKKTNYIAVDDLNTVNNKINRLNELIHVFSPFTKGTFVISEGAKTTSNPLSIAFDYIRMIFHIDIIKYNSMTNFIKEHIDEAVEIYNIVGDFDKAVSVEKYKAGFETLCKPVFTGENRFIITDGYHPLLKKPVSNSIDTEKCILITGCNASGKSTFLKTVAINALFAQCFGFSFAKEYKAPLFKIYSSMALKDDINAGESYFVSEIKSLKRIIDDVNGLHNLTDGLNIAETCDSIQNNINGSDINDESTSDIECTKVLCFIDEVLRGTNTVERIAASVEILNSLSKANVFCFAATHDIELTELLSDNYENYHFTEEVKDNDVIFSYKIIKGVADSKNAIKLLSVLGYDENIVRNAESRADKFVKSGVWA